MFLNPLMLVGVGAAVVPFVLHLLSRARYRDVDWGAMMFLQGADVRRNQSARFTQILLLFMRSAAIALLAVALARPVIRGKWVGQESETKMTAVLLLDCSASMGFDENGRTRFQMAQSAARQIIRGLRQGDRVALILMGAPAYRPANANRPAISAPSKRKSTRRSSPTGKRTWPSHWTSRRKCWAATPSPRTISTWSPTARR